MVAALIIICVLLLGSVALNFLFIKILKNTLTRLEMLYEYTEIQENVKEGKAYNGKYYPGHVIMQMKYDCDNEMIIADFSQYEEHQIIGIMLYDKSLYPAEEYMKLGVTREQVERPQFHPNVTVFQPMEGMWTWK